MGSPVTLQNLIDAGTDSATLAEVVNGDSTQTHIPLRLGGTTQSLRAAVANVIGGSLNTVANAWQVNLDGQVFYFEGASTERAPHSGGTFVAGATAPTGGLPNAYPNIFATGDWAGGHGTFYNDAQDGSTSSQALARYNAGSTNYGVTVPSAHSVSPAQNTGVTRGFYFLGLAIAFNDIAGLGLTAAQSITNIQALVAKAKADGFIVVLMTNAMICTVNPAGTVQLQLVMQAARNGAGTTLANASSIPSDLVVDLALCLTNVSDATFYDPVDRVHPTIVGHFAQANFLTAAMIKRAMDFPRSGPFESRAATFAGGLTILPPNGSSGYQQSTIPVQVGFSSITSWQADVAAFFTTVDGLQSVIVQNNGSNGIALSLGVDKSQLRSTINSTQSDVGNAVLALQSLGGAIEMLGPVFFGNTTIGGSNYYGSLTSRAFNLPLKTIPTATSTGTVGDMCWDANYIYVCVATNTWKRIAVATW